MVLNQLTIINQTSTALTYAGGTVSVPANGSSVVSPTWYAALLADNNFIADIQANNILLNDGIKTYSNSAAESILHDLSPKQVTTQYELNDKDLKLAKMIISLSGTNSQSASIKVPGTFGSIQGRYVAGGYAISQDYNPDDYVTVTIQDTDRLIAQAIKSSQGLSYTPTDANIQAMGYIAAFGQAFPQYPIVKSYTDTDLPLANQGWYFWPLAMGNTAVPAGECEVEPIGGYGFLPAGFYIILTYTRPTGITTGACRINVYWGEIE